MRDGISRPFLFVDMLVLDLKREREREREKDGDRKIWRMAFGLLIFNELISLFFKINNPLLRRNIPAPQFNRR